MNSKSEDESKFIHEDANVITTQQNIQNKERTGFFNEANTKKISNVRSGGNSKDESQVSIAFQPRDIESDQYLGSFSSSFIPKELVAVEACRQVEAMKPKKGLQTKLFIPLEIYLLQQLIMQE